LRHSNELGFIVSIVPDRWVEIFSQSKTIKQYDGSNGFKHKEVKQPKG
jgi:hypothetical protein